MPSIVINGNKVGGTVDDATLIRYNNEDSTLESNRIQDAITELDEKVEANKVNLNEKILEIDNKVDTNFIDAKAYADTVGQNIKDDLLNGAGTAYDTLKELGDLIDVNHDAIDALETVAASKQDAATAINTENIGNQSVNYATSAGSCTGNAATATKAGNVTGVVAIANGGTGATTAAAAYQNLHPTNHATGIAYVSGMNANGYSGGGGYATVAQLKQAMALNNVNNTADANKSVKYATSAGTATNAGTLTNKAADSIFVSCSGGNNPGSFGFDSNGRPVIRVYSTSAKKYIPIVFSPSGLIVDGSKEVEW